MRSHVPACLVLVACCACATPRAILDAPGSPAEEREARVGLDACTASAGASLGTPQSRLRQGGMLGAGAVVGSVSGLGTFPVWDDDDLGTQLAASAAAGAAIGVVGGFWVLAREWRDDYRNAIRSCMRDRGFPISGFE